MGWTDGSLREDICHGECLPLAALRMYASPSLRMPLREAAPPIASFTTPARGMSFIARMGTPLFSLRIDRPHSWLCSECARTARPARWPPWP